MAWIVTTLEKFSQYGISITTERQLSTGEYIMHLSLAELPDFWIESRFDTEVKVLTCEQMDELLALEEQSIL